MPDAAGDRVFPTDDALCERCGYPLRGLAAEMNCPECGMAVAESSPAKRVEIAESSSFWFHHYPSKLFAFLGSPRVSFQTLPIDGSNWPARRFLLVTCVLAAAFWSQLSPDFYFVSPYARPDRRWFSFSPLVPFLVFALTYIEMLGVTGFSRKRGWRVPFKLAERVCCYASVGWLPGVLLAGGGAWLLHRYAAGQPWFESMLGLVRVSWVFYGALFVISLLWFEMLVWLGVRQVKFANAWGVPLKRDGRSHQPPTPTTDPQLTDN